MSDPSFTTHGDEPVEARIVSWVLGEASAFEAAELERLCDERPELMVFKRRMLALHGLLAEAETVRPDDDKWKLSPEKRRALDDIFGQEKPIRLEVDKRIRHNGRRALLAIAACVVLTLIVFQFVVPVEYRSEAIIEVRPRSFGMSPLGSEMAESAGAGQLTPQFFGTEFEKIKSRNSLEKVVENLDLTNRWNVDKETALNILKGSIDTRNIRGTDLIAIDVTHANKHDASDIAGEVVNSYKAYRREIEIRDAERQLAELNKAVRDQEDKVEERRKVLSTIVRNKGIIYKGDGSFQVNDRAMAMNDDSHEDAIKRGLDAQDYADAKRDYETDQQLLQTMKLKQMGETISRKIPGESVEIHDGPVVMEASRPKTVLSKLARLWKDAPFTAKSADAKENALASNSPRTRRLETELPKELIEGTPKPMNVPNLEAPADGPAGSGTWSMAERSHRSGDAGEQDLKPSSPAAPPASMAKVVAANSSPATAVPVPDVDVTAPSLDFGDRDDSGTGWGDAELAAEGNDDKPAGRSGHRSARPRAVPDGDENGRIGGQDDSRPATDPAVANADKLAESITAGNRSGSGSIEKGSIDAILDDAASAGEKAPIAAKQKSQASEAPADMPVLGRLFSQADKNDLSMASDYSDSDVTKSGTNTYSGGTGVTGNALGIGGSGGGGFAASDSDAKPKEPGMVAGDSSLGLNDTLTDGASKKDEGKLVGGIEIVGGSKFELKPGSTSEYNFKGADLSDSDAAPKIEITREFKYPTEYEPPELPNHIVGFTGTSNDVVFPETPDKPQSGPLPDSVREKNLPAIRGMIVDGRERENQPAEGAESAKSDYHRAAYDNTRAELLSQVDSSWELKVPAEETVARASRPQPAQTMPAKAAGETPVPPSDEIPAAEDPYSTFSLNISDASFQVAQAALAKGEQPDPAGIKVEQFYNAVDYGDPAPASNEPVAVNIEQSAHPVIPGRNLVRIALKTAAAGRLASQPLRLTLLVDQSGSMVREDRRVAMDKALAGLSKLLTKNDLVTVIGFSRTPRLLADGMSGDKAGKLADLVNQAASEGGTNLEEAMKLGEQLAGRHQLAGAQNRIVLFTDGAANLGNADPERLAEKVKQLRQKGIAFDIAGIAADDLNDELLGELARNGNGRYYVVGKGGDDNFAKQLAGAFRPAAENVKVQVRFNPERVLRYKLIGFEKDRLKTEDFRNDKVDAAELAAEEAGVAIYQVEPNPEGNGELGEVSVRFRDTASGEMVERGWTIPHDTAAPAIDRATPSMQLAVLAMLAGEKLKGGPLAAAIDFKQLAGAQADVKRSYGGNARVAEVLRMVDALK